MTISRKTLTPVTTDEIPTTTEDMEELFTWKKGDIVRGSHAKAHLGMYNYIKDIENAPDPKDYKAKYIDTTKPVGEQLKKLK